MTSKPKGTGSTSKSERTASWQQIGAFFTWLSLLVVAQFLGQDGTDLINWMCSSIGKPFTTYPLLWCLGFLILLFIAACTARAWTEANPRMDDWRKWGVATCLLTAIVTGNTACALLADGLSDAVGDYRSLWHWKLLWFAGGCLAWLFLYYRISPNVHYFFETPKDFMEASDPDPPLGDVTLVMHVSPHNDLRFNAEEGLVTDRSGRQFKLGFRSIPEDIAILDGGDLNPAPGDDNGSRWPWQQLLRGINRYVTTPQQHRSRKLRILLIGSKDSAKAGTFHHLDECIRFLKCYPELRHAEIESYREALDFENYNEMKDAIRKVLADESKTVNEKSVFVDITGGPKTASVAAAAATMGANGMFQYIQTTHPNSRIVFDIHPQSVMTPGN